MLFLAWLRWLLILSKLLMGSYNVLGAREATHPAVTPAGSSLPPMSHCLPGFWHSEFSTDFPWKGYPGRQFVVKINSTCWPCRSAIQVIALEWPDMQRKGNFLSWSSTQADGCNTYSLSNWILLLCLQQFQQFKSSSAIASQAATMPA